MAKTSAGVLLYRRAGKSLEVFLVHPGGPFWAKKDDGAWSIPKGEFARGQDPVEVAKREFEEETGFPLKGKLQALEPAKQAGGKIVYAWAVEGEIDASAIRSNRSEEHTSELQSRLHLVCRLLLEKKKKPVQPRNRDENAHNDKSVPGELNPTSHAGLRRDAVPHKIEPYRKQRHELEAPKRSECRG